MPRLACLHTRPCLIATVSAFLVLADNLRFFREAEAVFPLAGNAPFLGSLALLLWAVITLLALAFNTRHTLKPALVLLLVIAAGTGYFSDRFGIVVDDGMLVNVLETDAAEIADLLTPGLFLHLFLFALLPGVAVARWPLARRGALAELLGGLKLAATALVLALLCLLSAGTSYASFFREYKPVRYYTNPTYPIYSAIKLALASGGRAIPAVRRQIYPDAAPPPGDPDRELMILVVGESARADHFSLYGYSRPTNPVLQKLDNLYAFTRVQSCGTATAVSVPCMFSQLPRAEFTPDVAAGQDDLLDVLKRAGVAILWRDNNSGSKGVADRVAYRDFRSPGVNPVCDVECRDVGMLSGLQDYIDRQRGDVLIVLHQMGSHGPAYYKRVPAGYDRFQPTCRSKLLNECTQQEIVNAYDNTILYTDWFLGQVVELLEANQDRFEVAMLYVSDHGESLGENGVYLHGMPYLVSPAAQTHVPMLLWKGVHSDIDNAALDRELDQPLSHDVLWSTLLEFYEIRLTRADEANSIIMRDEK